MDPRDQLQILWCEIADLPPQVQYDRLVRFFTESAKDISDDDLILLKGCFEHEDNDVATQLAQIIEGQLALRRLSLDAPKTSASEGEHHRGSIFRSFVRKFFP